MCNVIPYRLSFRDATRRRSRLVAGRNPYSPQGLWIPGSRFARPGMTNSDVVGSQAAMMTSYSFTAPVIADT